MEDLQTDTLSDYVKNQNVENMEFDGKDDNAVNLLNGCEDIDDPLDLMDHCDNESLGSDVWKGSDSEDEIYDKDGPSENLEKNENMNENFKSIDNKIEEKKTDEECGKVNSKEDKSVEEAQSSDTFNNKTEVENIVIESEHPKNVQTVSENIKEKQLLNENSENEDKSKGDIEESEQKQLVNKEKNTSGKGVTADKSDNVESSEECPKKITNIEKTTGQITETSEKTENESPVTEKEGKTDVPTGEANSEKIDESRENEESQMDYNEDDDDFDPSLLCPEVSMAVDENPVITNNTVVPSDGDTSPLPYEPVFSTFVDEVTGAEISFNLNTEELELRKRLYGPTNPIQYTKIHCTACNVHLGSALETQNNRFVHPLLKVLICKKCYHFYTSGEFEKDEDGSELYCRWCGQGGQVLCCSKCEFVFCKRCIRNNFGRKKMFEIRDSENWDCFRCAPNQLITQRVACYELFEYIRKQMALGNNDTWTKDYTRCCSNNAKKRLTDEDDGTKPKRRKGDVDPDYSPLSDVLEDSGLNNNSKVVTAVPVKRFLLPNPIQLVKAKDNDIEFVKAIPAPKVSLASVRTAGSVPTFRTILPNTARPVQMPTVVRINQPLPSLVPATNRVAAAAAVAAAHCSTPNIMKHEWFEKTVRAAARVNSHLSYTLTQLNKAQSQAASVEELAVVHNKLQEILSSSINSLIQIRKNLRTEFIAGIKTVKLPSKKAAETFSNDDDVIFVSAPTTVMPMPALTPRVTEPPDPIVIVDNSTKVTTDRPRLKVKSVKELQNVPAECITIPDDIPVVVEEEKKGEAKVKKTEEVVCNELKKVDDAVRKSPQPENPTCEKSEMVHQCDKLEENSHLEKSEKDPTSEKSEGNSISESNTQQTEEASSVQKTKGERDLTEKESTGKITRRSKKVTSVYNIRDEPSDEIKKMLSVKVSLLRVNLEDLQKKLLNGCH